MSNATAIFRSDLQERVLREVCADPSPRTATDIAASIRSPLSTVAREVSRLVESGMLHARPEGRRTLLTANLQNHFMRAASEAIAFDRLVEAEREKDGPWRISTSRIAASMREELEAGNESMALRLMLDGINRMPLASALGKLDEMLDEPGSTGDERWDTLLAACVQYRCRKLGVRAPAWTRKEPLVSWWWPAGEHAQAAMTLQRTPIDFKRLGIWFSERNFATA